MHLQWGPFKLLISYSQLLVYPQGISSPVFDWTDQDVEKGYVQQEQAISFATLSNSTATVIVRRSRTPVEADLVLPFSLHQPTVIITSPMAKKWEIPIPVGTYQLGFQAIPEEARTANGLYRVRYELTFME